jgi:hypothetical protein
MIYSFVLELSRPVHWDQEARIFPQRDTNHSNLKPNKSTPEVSCGHLKIPYNMIRAPRQRRGIKEEGFFGCRLPSDNFEIHFFSLLI